MELDENLKDVDFKGKSVFIIPHTHWDREWYKPFQEFRFRLIQLIDQLIEYCKNEEYVFLLDGQTIVLEDYLEVRPERREELIKLISEGRIIVGPWYVLPDEWLVGGESIIRNLEISNKIAEELEIPLMKVAYLPDQFGHSAAIPQIISNLTNIRHAVIWRGVGEEIQTCNFNWKRDVESKTGLFTQYLAYSYSNAAVLPHDFEEFKREILSHIKKWDKYIQVPYYLLMNGTDHQFPDFTVSELVKKLKEEGVNIKLSSLDKYLDEVEKALKESNIELQCYSGEFRSSKRAPLLQDTYSTRIWIKQLNQLNEDLLVKQTEPICSYLALLDLSPYPYSLIVLAWKWLLKNQPHDSICGCSIDQVHNEMKARYLWSMSIGRVLVENGLKILQNAEEEKLNNQHLVVFSGANGVNRVYLEFDLPENAKVDALIDKNGNYFPIQKLSTSEEIFYHAVMSPLKLKLGLQLLPGRKIADIYINSISIEKDPFTPKTCKITLFCDKKPTGELDIHKEKERILETIKTKKFKKFDITIKKAAEQRCCATLPISGWRFNLFDFTTNALSEEKSLELPKITSKSFENQYFTVKFNKDGTISVTDKATSMVYHNLHKFEDYGDRGDEYTFSRVGPEKSRITNLRRVITENGPVLYEIRQEFNIKVYRELSKDRGKRIGKTTIPVVTYFRFYKDIPRIDIRTILKNTAKDHRLRVLFQLPFQVNQSITSTHFGFIKRTLQVPKCTEDYEECPSGIQPQKRFIRLDATDNDCAFSLFNNGLPEVEVIEGNTIALTLLRSVGYLSCTNIPERPAPAGPVLPTYEAQLVDVELEYDYSIYIHRNSEALSKTYNNAESFSIKPICFTTSNPKGLEEPIIYFENEQIKINSIRSSHSNNITVTVFNISNKEVITNVVIHPRVASITQINIDGELVKQLSPDDFAKTDGNRANIRISFKPYEIKLIELKLI